MKRVTIQDIAKEMGLSRNTVAKALSDGAVSAQTKYAVVQKAMEMGYAKLDDSLVTEYQEKRKRTNSGTILVLFNHWQSVFWNRALAGISTGVSEEGYRMQLHIVDDADEDGEETLQVIGSDVKGILFLCVFPIRFVKGIEKAGLPMTFFNTPVNAIEYIERGDVYNVESFYSMNHLTSYVIEKKDCRKLSFIGYAEGSRVVQARFLGYMNACNQHGIQLDDAMQFTRPSNQTYFSYGMVEEAINRMPYMPDAIICENDDIAKCVALVLVQRDPDLARRMVITGFDNTIEEDFFKKDIITVEVRIEELGKRLVRSLIDRVKNPQMDIAFVTVATYPVLDK